MRTYQIVESSKKAEFATITIFGKMLSTKDFVQVFCSLYCSKYELKREILTKLMEDMCAKKLNKWTNTNIILNSKERHSL